MLHNFGIPLAAPLSRSEQLTLHFLFFFCLSHNFILMLWKFYIFQISTGFISGPLLATT